MNHEKLFPRPESTWSSPKDLLLVLHLACLAAGYAPFLNVATRVTTSAHAHAFIRCVEQKSKNGAGCQATFCMVEWLNPKNPTGPCKMHLPPRIVSAVSPGELNTVLAHHHSQENSGHARVCPPLLPASTPLELKVGTTVFDAGQVTAIEASLRSAARRAKCQMSVVRTKDLLFKCRGKDSNDLACSFQVRLVPAPGGSTTDFTCKEITPDHSCLPEFEDPTPELDTVLSYFAPINLTAGVIGKPKLQTSRVANKNRPPRIPRKPKQKQMFESDDDEVGALSDDALDRLCKDLITICPPSPPRSKSPSVPPSRKRSRAASPSHDSDLPAPQPSKLARSLDYLAGDSRASSVSIDGGETTDASGAGGEKLRERVKAVNLGRKSVGGAAGGAATSGTSTPTGRRKVAGAGKSGGTPATITPKAKKGRGRGADGAAGLAAEAAPKSPVKTEVNDDVKMEVDSEAAETS